MSEVNESIVEQKDNSTEEQPNKKAKRTITPKKTGRTKIDTSSIIENKKSRRSTFSKRKKGVIKKIEELVSLTNSSALFFLVSETNKVYTFSSGKLKELYKDPDIQEKIKKSLGVETIEEEKDD